MVTYYRSGRPRCIKDAQYKPLMYPCRKGNFCFKTKLHRSHAQSVLLLLFKRKQKFLRCMRLFQDIQDIKQPNLFLKPLLDIRAIKDTQFPFWTILIPLETLRKIFFLLFQTLCPVFFNLNRAFCFESISYMLLHHTYIFRSKRRIVQILLILKLVI